MTIDRVLLRDLIEKSSEADLLREMMTFVVNRMMDLEVESLTGIPETSVGQRLAADTRTISEPYRAMNRPRASLACECSAMTTRRKFDCVPR